MGKSAILYLMLVLLPIANAVCITPTENAEIKENAVFCSGTYNLQSGVNVVNDNIIVDCNNSILTGNGVGYGILLNKRRNIIVKNCNISNYEIGIYLDSANNSIINNNYLTKNKFGIASFNSFGNSIDNNFLAGNLDDKISYIPLSLIEEKEALQAGKKEETNNPQKIMEEVIRIKKPFLNEADVLGEVNLILDRYFNITQENLEIKRTVLYNESDKSTRIILNLKPKKVLINLSVYELIPKCISTYVNQILFEAGGYEVVKKDPLIMWSFSMLGNEEELSYKVFKNIDNDCKSLLLSFGIAAEFKEFEEAKGQGKNTNHAAFLIIGIILIILVLYYITQTSRQS